MNLDLNHQLIVSTCNLNQWALDFDGNLERVCESIRIAKEAGASYRLGPELELCGYGCEDHFLEMDTLYHCWESLGTILTSNLTDGILCDIGMPVLHKNVRYNCRVFCLNRKIIAIRPKICMADDGNYRETRWFTAWKEDHGLDDFILPVTIQTLTSQIHVPFGIAALECLDTTLGSETCEELFTPDAPHIRLGLAGVEIIGNGSGSHHELRKLHTRLELITSATRKSGGIYLYANQQGCDGGRLYYDGCALIVVNGDIVAQGSQFSVLDVEVITACVDLEQVRTYRGGCSSRSAQASAHASAASTSTSRLVAVVHVGVSLTAPRPWLTSQQHTSTSHRRAPSPPITSKTHLPEEEIAYGPACWLWDYLRRSGATGFFLPLSGGADSSAVAALVGIMCHLVTVAATNPANVTVRQDIQRLLGQSQDAGAYNPLSASELMYRVMHTTYMGSCHSSVATKDRAATLASQLGAYHLVLSIDSMVAAVVKTFETVTGRCPVFSSQGGTRAQDLALQNIQARLRMVMGYNLAQLLPWVRHTTGFLLVLGAANVDEGLRGYMTKYDCSSADINPIGSVSKADLQRFLTWAATAYDYPALLDIVAAPPTAELQPQATEPAHVITDSTTTLREHSQQDEEDMGMSYLELGIFGRLRKIDKCGPVWMFKKLLYLWSEMTPTLIAEKVKRFFYYYSVNRHKMTTLTPSYHAENYSPDDNRFDLRPFLYQTKWTRQFNTIDSITKNLKEE